MNGTVYTFYSYKGGVGRSMALANIGMHFFRSGLTTLLVDWDLEAPGLERFFEERYGLDLNAVLDRPGLCDMLKLFMDNAAQPPSTDDDSLPYPPLADFLFELERTDDEALWLLHAGRRAEGTPWQEYVSFVQGFDWAAFYRDWEGGLYVEWLRNELKAAADVILIDSRTGVTEMGGVATQHLADVVVLLCGANVQNLDNTARMSRNFTSEAVKKARSGRQLDILVAPARIDDADSTAYLEFIGRFRSAFANLEADSLASGYDAEAMLIPYLPHFSYRERLIVGDPQAETAAARLLKAYQTVAANMRDLADEHSPLRQGRTPTGAGAVPRVYLVCGKESASLAQKIKDYLEGEQVEVRGLENVLRRTVDEYELRQSHAVVLVLAEPPPRTTEGTLGRVVRLAEETAKPVVPVLARKFSLPFWLGDRTYIDLSEDRQGVRQLQGLRQLHAAILRYARGVRESETGREFAEGLVFLSYSREDADLAAKIARRLRADGIRLWFDRDDLLPGEDSTQAIEAALSRARAMVALVPHLVPQRSSALDSVERQWSFMIRLGKPILPVVLHSASQIPHRLADFSAIELTGDFEVGLASIRQALEWLLAPTLTKGDKAGLDLAASDHLDGIAREPVDLSQASYRRALRIAEEHGDRQGIALSSVQLGAVALKNGAEDQALSWFRKALDIFEELGDQRGLAATYHQLGIVAQGRGDYAQARAQYLRSLQIEEALGNQTGMAISFNQLGMLAQLSGDLEAAHALYERSLAIHQKLDNRAGIAAALSQLGGLAQDRGDYEQALALYRESLAFHEELLNLPAIAAVSHQLGILAQVRADYELALAWYQKSLAAEESLGNRAGMAISHHQLGILAQLQGDYEQALAWYQKSLAISEELGNLSYKAGTTSQLGVLAVQRGFPEEAVTFQLQSLGMRVRADPRTIAPDLYWLHRERQLLGEERFLEIVRTTIGQERTETVLQLLQHWTEQNRSVAESELKMDAAGEGVPRH